MADKVVGEHSEYTVGVDLGQRADHTAIVVIEKFKRVIFARNYVTYGMDPESEELQFRVGYAERLPLGTPYPQVMERLKWVTRQPPLAKVCTVVVDATGVGAPVVDWLKREGFGKRLRPVMITGGSTETSAPDGVMRVPKQDLIAGVQVLFEKKQLIVAKPFKALQEELLAFEGKRTKNGRMDYAARSGAHDDFVMALALACWHGDEPPFGHRKDGALF